MDAEFRHLAIAFMAATLLALSIPAAAQDNAAEPSEVPALRRPDLTEACAPREGLSLCLKPVFAARARARRAFRERVGALTRFTRLAGMFMGRSDAAELGSLKVRFNLELR